MMTIIVKLPLIRPSATPLTSLRTGFSRWQKGRVVKENQLFTTYQTSMLTT